MQKNKKDLLVTPSPSTVYGVESLTGWRKERMLTMSDIHCIKHLRNNKGLSITKIQETLGINWRTAKKYADETNLPEPTVPVSKGMMKNSKWGEMVTDWLIEDSRLSRKKRRNKKQLYLELKEHGFQGSYRTVCYFISEWQASHNEMYDKGYERLNHPPSEAQVDFGLMEVVKDGEYVDIHVLVMSFPFSNAAYAVPLPAENQECFLVGLKQLFKQAEGVPRRIRIDNLTPAVKKTRSKFNEAELTDAYLQFQNHYGFETQVCNPRSGHEKGSVENKVGYVRYNFFSASPVMVSLEELTEALFVQLTKDRQREHYKKDSTIEELWQREKAMLLAISEEDYPVFKQLKVKVNKFNETKLDQALIHIPFASNYPILYLHLEWDCFKAISSDGDVLMEGHRPYMNKRRAIPWLMVFKAWIQKPRAVPYSRYQKYLPGRINDYLSTEQMALRKARLIEMANLLARYEMKEINESFYELISGDGEESFNVNWEQYDALVSLEDLDR